MTSRLVIIRGNSGSGKTTIAKRLQREMGYGTMLVSQDMVRREILRVEDKPDNPAHELIRRMVLYGKEIGYDVVLEGILSNKKYRSLLDALIREFDRCVYPYYFHLPFEETLRRHATKPNTHEFGEEEMREWWKDDDRLELPNERVLDHTLSEDAIVEMILRDIG